MVLQQQDSQQRNCRCDRMEFFASQSLCGLEFQGYGTLQSRHGDKSDTDNDVGRVWCQRHGGRRWAHGDVARYVGLCLKNFFFEKHGVKIGIQEPIKRKLLGSFYAVVQRQVWGGRQWLKHWLFLANQQRGAAEFLGKAGLPSTCRFRLPSWLGKVYRMFVAGKRGCVVSSIQAQCCDDVWGLLSVPRAAPILERDLSDGWSARSHAWARGGIGRRGGRRLAAYPLTKAWHQARARRPKIRGWLPNVLTIASLCMGLSALRFAWLQQWSWAVTSVLVAAFLDGIDGRLARLLHVSSDFGAELDSLADFVNFGIAPPMIVYVFTLHHWGAGGWWLCLMFSIAMALRLARFNIQRHQQTSGLFSQGVPAPAGAVLLLTPMMIMFVTGQPVATSLLALTTFVVACLLISTYPTFVFKKIMLPPAWRSTVVVVILGIIAGLVCAPWETLSLLSVAYMLSLPASGWLYYSKGVR